VTEHAATSTTPARASFRSRLWRDLPFFFIAVAVIVLDQVTKALVRARLDLYREWPHEGWILRLVNVHNSGAAFGMLQGQTVFLVITSVVGVAAIVLYYMYPPLEHGLLRIALALQLGGAAGNLIDRVRSGQVTDFIKFDWWFIDFPAFNVADSSITIGVITILWFFLVIESERLIGPPKADG
jgi:signal peptidase II